MSSTKVVPTTKEDVEAWTRVVPKLTWTKVVPRWVCLEKSKVDFDVDVDERCTTWTKVDGVIEMGMSGNSQHTA